MITILKTFITLLMLTSLSTAFASKTSKTFMPGKTTNLSSNVNIDKSTFKWTGTKKIGDKHYGSVDLKDATVKMKDKKIVGGTFNIDMASMKLDPEDLKGNTTLRTKLINHLKDADFFNVTEHPKATLVIDKMSNNVAHGKLTIKGKELPIKIPYTQTGKMFNGKMTFDRTKYDMGYGTPSFMKKIGKFIEKNVIDDNVTIDFKVSLQ